METDLHSSAEKQPSTDVHNLEEPLISTIDFFPLSIRLLGLLVRSLSRKEHLRCISEIPLSLLSVGDPLADSALGTRVLELLAQTLRMCDIPLVQVVNQSLHFSFFSFFYYILLLTFFGFYFIPLADTLEEKNPEEERERLKSFFFRFPLENLKWKRVLSLFSVHLMTFWFSSGRH